VASSGVFIIDVVSMVFFPAFSTVFPKCNTFDVLREVVGCMVDNKGGTAFVNATGDGCQGDGYRSLTCVTFRAGCKVG